MPTTLVCDHHGQRFVADISVSGLDAFTYRAETGEDLDLRIKALYVVRGDIAQLGAVEASTTYGTLRIRRQ